MANACPPARLPALRLFSSAGSLPSVQLAVPSVYLSFPVTVGITHLGCCSFFISLHLSHSFSTANQSQPEPPLPYKRSKVKSKHNPEARPTTHSPNPHQPSNIRRNSHRDTQGHPSTERERERERERPTKPPPHHQSSSSSAPPSTAARD